MTPPPTDLPSTASLLAPSQVRLCDALETALREVDLSSVPGTGPVDRRDRFLTLLQVYDLHTAPLELVGNRVRLQHAPEVAALKQRLEQPWLDELDQAWQDAEALAQADSPERVAQAMRAVAAKDRLPPAYRWLARDASWDELVEFLALEGGPDGGFDDLVALCQVGLSGSAKLELGKNYWDEMGRGQGAGVHTVLHQDMARALRMRPVPRAQLPEEALERIALGGLLATNRWLQPEMLGALGLVELQAGPRCRLVLQGLDRLGAPAGAYPFYLEHAEVDPVHGKDWLDKAVIPTVVERPEWGPRIVRGAWWRSVTNLRFFEAMRVQLAEERHAA